MGDDLYAFVSLMNERSMSQSELAKLAGLSTSSLSRYAAGHEMPVSAVKAIAKALGVSTDEVIGVDARRMLPPDQQELVDIYRALDERGRAMLLASARALKEG